MTSFPCPSCRTDNSEFNPQCQRCGFDLTIHSMEATHGNRAQPATDSEPHAADQAHRGGELDCGPLLDDFRIESKLGEGAMGSVYAAWDTRLERPVAIKILRDDRLSDEERRHRLFAEAKSASALNHRNIVTIYGIQEASGVTFISMERLKGQTLSQAIPKEGLPVNRVLEYAQGAANGLAHAHRAGMVHRDIKPANTMITTEGQVKILDFGLARQHDWSPAEEERTRPPHPVSQGLITGTLPYLSPERVKGAPADARSDVFSFGVMLYEMLTGRRPFEDKTKEGLCRKICDEAVPPIGSLRPDVPDALANLIRSCLCKDPAQRPLHGGALASQIQKIREAGLAAALRGSSASPSDSLFFRLRKPLTALTLALGVLLVLTWTVLTPGPPLKFRSLAILPLENLSGDPSLDVFGGGISAALNTQLGVLARDHPNLWIVPSNELGRFEQPTAATVYRELGVSHVLAGNVRYHGTKWRVTLQLIHARQSRLMDSAALDLDAETLSQAQTEVLTAAFDLMGWKPDEALRRTLTELATKNDGAYGDYLRGLGFMYRHDREGHLSRAIEALERAVALDPEFVSALAALSEAYVLDWGYGFEPEDLDRAEQRARQALRVRDDLADPHMALGRVSMRRGEHETAAAQYRKALALDADHQTVRYHLAKALDKLDRYGEAEKMYEAAAAHAPYDWIGRTEQADFFYRRGRYPEAESIFRDLIELAPQNVMGYSNLAVILFGRGAVAEAETLLRQALDIQPTAWLYSTLGTLLYFRDDFAASADAFEQALVLSPDNYLFCGNLADAYAALGEPERAREAYLRAIALLRDALAVNPNEHRFRSDLALYLAKLGQERDALAELGKIGEPDDMELVYKSAQIHEIAGNRERALSFLARAIESNYPLDEIMKEPAFHALRADPAFSAILETRPPFPDGAPSQ